MINRETFRAFPVDPPFLSNSRVCQPRARWPESVRMANRLDGLSRDPPQLDDQHVDKRPRTDPYQIIGGQTFPPGMPLPTPSAVPAETVPVDSSSSDRTPVLTPQSGSRVNCVVDSGSLATSLSENGTDDDEDFVLHCGSDVLLAGGRNEINLKDPKWKEAAGKSWQGSRRNCKQSSGTSHEEFVRMIELCQVDFVPKI